MQTRILLVFTGGTIGSLSENGNIDLDPNARFKLLELFKQRYQNSASIEFKTLQPLQILSENLHPGDWNTLIEAIESENLAAYDGIIITHGTDTLAFSAAALGLYFNYLKKPMLLVSSNLPLENPEANGIPNLIAAVDFIAQNQAAGVFVAYQNAGQKLEIHQATRLSSCLPLSGDFISIQSQSFMHYEAGKFEQNYPLATSAKVELKADFSARILLIRPYPGLNYQDFNLDKVDAVLHDLYHSGTACTRDTHGDSYNLSSFIQHCQQRALPIYLSPSIYSESAYSSTRELLARGAEMLWNTSIETSYAKLLLALSNFSQPEDVVAFLQSNIAGEHIQRLSANS